MPMAQTFLPVLTEVEKASLSERQPLPLRYRRSGRAHV